MHLRSEAVAKIVGLSSAVSIDADGSVAIDSPIASEGSYPQAKRTRLWVEALVIAWLCWVYDAINNLAPLRVHAALAHGWGVLHLERSLGLDPELTLNRWLVGHHTLALLLSDYYDNAHFIVTLGLLGWLWYRRADIYRPLRNTLVMINVIGLAVFWLYPTAPPRLLPGSGFDDVVASTHALGGWHTGPLATVANQFAALPSLHMAWAAWCSLVLWSMSRRYGCAASRSSTRASLAWRCSPRATTICSTCSRASRPRCWPSCSCAPSKRRGVRGRRCDRRGRRHELCSF